MLVHCILLTSQRHVGNLGRCAALQTRLFCQFDSEPASAPTVLREVRHHEGTFADLRKAGAPAEGPAYADPDTAAAALMAVAPIGVTQYRIEQLCL